MQIKFNDEVIFELSEIDRATIEYSIPSDELEEDLKRRIIWVIEEKIKGRKAALRRDFLPLLRAENDTLPTNQDALIPLILARDDYKDRSTRDEEARIEAARLAAEEKARQDAAEAEGIRIAAEAEAERIRLEAEIARLNAELEANQPELPIDINP